MIKMKIIEFLRSGTFQTVNNNLKQTVIFTNKAGHEPKKSCITKFLNEFYRRLHITFGVC